MKKIPNTYELSNASQKMTPEEIRKALSDFRFFMSNYAQIVGKDRKLHPFELNPFQEMLFTQLLPLVKKETRLDRRLSLVILKPRQVGCTTGIIAFINYICAFLDNFENTSVCHVLPVADTISKLYTKKIEPIISGVHPDIYPTMEREVLGSSIITKYSDIKGIRRQNFYEVVSSGASSVRSDTINITIFDEVAFYKRPEIVADATLGSMPDYGFSLVIYMSTFDNRNNEYFLDKIRTALDEPDDWRLLFCPWFIIYPERPQGINYRDLELTEYDTKVILPAMMEYGVSETKWGDAIDWYHRKSRLIGNMLKEYPTTVQEVLAYSEDRCVFQQESLDAQEKNIMPGTPMRFVTDNATGKVEMQETDVSPFVMYKHPIYGHRYRMTIDPITAQSDGTDFFTMVIWDMANNEQVATFHERGLQDEDYADWAVSMGTVYNKAELCPESNVANAFCVAVNSRRYFRWVYQTKKSKSDRIPGIRTTVSSKELMLDRLGTLLDRENIIIHSAENLQELRDFIKVIKVRPDGSKYVRMMAKGSKHDDYVACNWILAGSLSMAQLEGRRHSNFAII